MQKMREIVLQYLLVLWLVMSGKTRGSPNVPDGCDDKCGEVSIVYPFGLEEPKCAFDVHGPFLLTCDNSTSPPSLMFGNNINAVNISVEEGLISVKNIDPAFNCYNEETQSMDPFDQSLTLGNNLRFSHQHNKLTVMGCDTLAFMSDDKGKFGTGCLSLCNEDVNFSQDNCSGIGCCQASLPQSLRALNYSLISETNNSDISGINPCQFAFLSDSRTFSFDFNLSQVTREMIKENVESVIEWVIEEKTCEEAKKSASYACRDNAECDYSNNGKGYRCLCKQGFAGNPYLHPGCQDIDECKDQSKYHCEGTCENTIGNYTCKCPFWMHGDGKVSCQVSRATKTVTVVGPLLLIGVIGFLIVIMLKKRRKTKNFLRNGGKLLEHQRVRIFSDAELTKATKNYDKSNFLGEGGFGSVYKGKLQDGTQVAVKKPKDFNKTHINEDFQHEIGIISQINHKNVVKILGICLETKIPLLVYEFVSNGSLDHYLHHQISLRTVRNWENCLRIAAEAALAFEYLHSLASPPVIHGDVKPANILLDEYYTAKVADFGASTIISPDQRIMASKIQGTLGYMDPEYLTTGDLTEKSDVYSFGVVLVELLMGEKPNAVARWGGKTTMQYFHSSLEANKLNEMLCFVVNSEDEMEEIQKFANLAKDCLCSIGDQRPTMKEVAEALGKLMEKHKTEKSDQLISGGAQDDNEGTTYFSIFNI